MYIWNNIDILAFPSQRFMCDLGCIFVIRLRSNLEFNISCEILIKNHSQHRCIYVLHSLYRNLILISDRESDIDKISGHKLTVNVGVSFPQTNVKRNINAGNIQ